MTSRSRSMAVWASPTSRRSRRRVSTCSLLARPSSTVSARALCVRMDAHACARMHMLVAWLGQFRQVSALCMTLSLPLILWQASALCMTLPLPLILWQAMTTRRPSTPCAPSSRRSLRRMFPFTTPPPSNRAQGGGVSIGCTETGGTSRWRRQVAACEGVIETRRLAAPFATNHLWPTVLGEVSASMVMPGERGKIYIYIYCREVSFD